MKDVKLSNEEVESLLKNMFDATSYMRAGGVFTSYGFLLSDYIKANTSMSTLQDVLTERYTREDKVLH